MTELVTDFAEAMQVADSKAPVATNARSGGSFAPGLGPHSENAALGLVLAELLAIHKWRGWRGERQVAYPRLPRAKADLRLLASDGAPGAVVEAKLLRLLGDNGKPNDNMLMHILSPYPEHRSAVTDVAKLSRSGFGERRIVLIFGYDSARYPAEPALRAFERVAADFGRIGRRSEARTTPLQHPVHSRGFAACWPVDAA